MLPTEDNLPNWFLTPPTKMRGFFEMLPEVFYGKGEDESGRSLAI